MGNLFLLAPFVSLRPRVEPSAQLGPECLDLLKRALKCPLLLVLLTFTFQANEERESGCAGLFDVRSLYPL